MTKSTEQIEVGFKVTRAEYKQLVINARIARLPLEEYTALYLSENMRTDLNNVPLPLRKPPPKGDRKEDGKQHQTTKS